MADLNQTAGFYRPTRAHEIAYQICEFSAGSCVCMSRRRRPCARAEDEADSIIRAVIREPEAFR